jgi:hypothetical protein
VIVDRTRWGCVTRKNRGDAACAKRLNARRSAVEELLPAGIKKDLMSEEACQVFEDQVARLLKAGRHDPRVAKLATQALRAARKRYRHGVASVLKVPNAQVALVRARQIDASRR